MYKNAEQKYKHLALFLQKNHAMDVDIYPQGSFALGTVVRPVIKGEDAGYDLDFVCQVKYNKNELSAKQLREILEEALSSSELYGGKLKVCPECLTIEYADLSGIGFSIDIVPAADETDEHKNSLRAKSQIPALLDTAIAIPQYGENEYFWVTNNPRGYREWFESINKPFADNSAPVYREILFKNNRGLFATVEDIPHGLNRSALQRVIQILKYHRDIFYSQYPDGEKIKPISAIINTVVTKIAATADPKYSVFELLEYVLNEFAVYSSRQVLPSEMFFSKYGSKNAIKKNQDLWIIENPANPEDNLADHWNENSDIPKIFFKWTNAAKKDLIEALHKSPQEFGASLASAFGSDIVAKTLGNKYRHLNAKPLDTVHPTKPWRQK